jgi:hypothetical protein
MKKILFLVAIILLVGVEAKSQVWDYNLQRIKTVQLQNSNADTVGRVALHDWIRGAVVAKSLYCPATKTLVDSFKVTNDTLFVYVQNKVFGTSNLPMYDRFITADSKTFMTSDGKYFLVKK